MSCSITSEVGPSDVTNKFYLLNIFDIDVYSIELPIKGGPFSSVGLNFLKAESIKYTGSCLRVCAVGSAIYFGGVSKSSMVWKSPATEAVAID